MLINQQNLSGVQPPGAALFRSNLETLSPLSRGPVLPKYRFHRLLRVHSFVNNGSSPIFPRLSTLAISWTDGLYHSKLATES